MTYVGGEDTSARQNSNIKTGKQASNPRPVPTRTGDPKKAKDTTAAPKPTLDEEDDEEVEIKPVFPN